MEEPDCETLLRYFDEINEPKTKVSTKDFEKHLLKWGIPNDKDYIARFDPEGKGYIKRQDLCQSLHYRPNPPTYLKEVDLIETDMSQHQRESIVKIVLEETKGGGPPKEGLDRIKARIEKVYGKEWSIFQAHGGFWGLCEYGQGSNLWFRHKGITYGVLRLPYSKATLKDYENFLVTWGMDPKRAKVYCSSIKPQKKKKLTREDVCAGLHFEPQQPPGLQDIEILSRDMPIRKSESIQVIVLSVLDSKSSKKDIVMDIKNQVEKIYGNKWNVYVANGRYWSVCTHKAGGNLVFAYKGAVYGIYQTPERTVEDSPFANSTSYAGVSSFH
ncbi:hypothetical protein Aperf_G00000071616 [Anoplocephala perfoliata]